MAIYAHRFRTEDKRFILTLGVLPLQRILELCSESLGMETGGILVGYYSRKHDDAIVTAVSGPPSDSKRKHTTFERGTVGLQPWLNELWSRHHRYYLGEWHFHPCAAPRASPDDIQQMRANAVKESLKCPEPVLLIVGGMPPHEWTANAYVSARGQDFMEMMSMNTHAGANQ